MSSKVLSGSEVTHLSIAVCVLSTVAVILRLLARWRSNVSFACDDWCIVDSLIPFYAMIECSTVCTSLCSRPRWPKTFTYLMYNDHWRKPRSADIEPWLDHNLELSQNTLLSVMIDMTSWTNITNSHDNYDHLLADHHECQDLAFDALSSNLCDWWIPQDLSSRWHALHFIMLHDCDHWYLPMFLYLCSIRTNLNNHQSMYQCTEFLLRYCERKSYFELYHSVNAFVHDIWTAIT